MRSIRLGLVCALAASACGSAVTPGDAAGTDASNPRDGSTLDAAVDDVAALDGAPIGESGADSPIDALADTTSDVSMTSLAGTWRAVAFEFRNAMGTMVRIADTNTPIPTPGGGTVPVRANGLLTLGPTRVAEAFGILANDHFNANGMAMAYENALSAYGFGAAGVLTPDSFVFRGGMMLAFTRNADETITQTDPMSGNRTTWARTTTLPIRREIHATGYAQLYRPLGTMPFANPRVALAWDRTGSAGGYTYTNDQPLMPGGGTGFMIDAVTPPTDAVGNVAGTSVAVAYLIVYDDRDDNGRYDGDGSVGDPDAGVTDGGGTSSDTLRGRSPIAIAFRSEGTPAAGFSVSTFRDLLPGMQYVHVHLDGAAFGRVTLAPFDPTNIVAPDVAINPDIDRSRIPDIVP